MTVRLRLPARCIRLAFATALPAVFLAFPTFAQPLPAPSTQPPSVAPHAQAATQSGYARADTIHLGPRATAAVDTGVEHDIREYRAPLALWYGLALGATWAPVLAERNCRGYQCLNVFAGPVLRMGFAWGPPAVHWRRGRVGRGFLSLGGQIAAVAIGTSIGSAVSKEPPCASTSDETECPIDFAPFIGWMIADVAWAAADVFLTPESVDLTSQQPAAATRFVPGFSASNDRWLLTLRGQLE